MTVLVNFKITNGLNSSLTVEQFNTIAGEDGVIDKNEWENASASSYFGGRLAFEDIASLYGDASSISQADLITLANKSSVGGVNTITDEDLDLASTSGYSSPITLVLANGIVSSVDAMPTGANHITYPGNEQESCIAEGLLDEARLQLQNKLMKWNVSECGLTAEETAKLKELLSPRYLDADGNFKPHGSGYSFTDEIKNLLSNNPALSAKVMPQVEQHEAQVNKVYSAYYLMKQEWGMLDQNYKPVSVDSEIWEAFKQEAGKVYSTLNPWQKSCIPSGDWFKEGV